jgi:hypothetical protein
MEIIDKIYNGYGEDPDQVSVFQPRPTTSSQTLLRNVQMI